jgi:hypothetical protein
MSYVTGFVLQEQTTPARPEDNEQTMVDLLADFAAAGRMDGDQAIRKGRSIRRRTRPHHHRHTHAPQPRNPGLRRTIHAVLTRVKRAVALTHISKPFRASI